MLGSTSSLWPVTSPRPRRIPFAPGPTAHRCDLAQLRQPCRCRRDPFGISGNTTPDHPPGDEAGGTGLTRDGKEFPKLLEVAPLGEQRPRGVTQVAHLGAGIRPAGARTLRRRVD